MIVADRGARLQLLRILEADLLEIILDLLDHLDDAPQAKIARGRIELGADVVLGAVAGAGGALDRVLHRLDDDHPVDQFLARDGVGDRDQLGLVGGDGAWALAELRWPCSVLSFFFDSRFLVSAPSARERRGRRDEPVGHQQFGVADRGERDGGLAEPVHVDPAPSSPSTPIRSPATAACGPRAARASGSAPRGPSSRRNPSAGSAAGRCRAS